MTPEQRAQEFEAIFDSLPGRNIDRIRKVCSILHCKPNTVRIYRIGTENRRIIPERQLQILRDALAREAGEKATDA